jgi:hypothetical protein
LIPMQAYAWMHARAAAVLRSPNLHLYALKEGPKVAALAPLLPEGNWLLELPRLHEPSDLVWSTPESLGELTAMLAAQPFPVDLERVPANSPTVAALRRAYARSGIVQVRPAMPTPVIALDMRWQEPAACFSAGRRSDFRRAERRARALGEVCYEIHSPASDTELDTLMNEAYAVEARSWKERAGTSLTADAWQGRFFRRFTRNALPSGVLRIAFMRVDGLAVAMQIATEWQQRFWLLKASYDEALSRCSPGQLLTLHTLGYAVRARLTAYEFMGVMADWTKLWTQQSRDYVRVRAIPFSATTAKLLVKKGAHTLFGHLRRFIR